MPKRIVADPEAGFPGKIEDGGRIVAGFYTFVAYVYAPDEATPQGIDLTTIAQLRARYWNPLREALVIPRAGGRSGGYEFGHKLLSQVTDTTIVHVRPEFVIPGNIPKPASWRRESRIGGRPPAEGPASPSTTSPARTRSLTICVTVPGLSPTARATAARETGSRALMWLSTRLRLIARSSRRSPRAGKLIGPPALIARDFPRSNVPRCLVRSQNEVTLSGCVKQPLAVYVTGCRRANVVR